jgi:hypothetical protein
MAFKVVSFSLVLRALTVLLMCMSAIVSAVRDMKFYKVLGVDPKASEKDIKKAYKKAALYVSCLPEVCCLRAGHSPAQCMDARASSPAYLQRRSWWFSMDRAFSGSCLLRCANTQLWVVGVNPL